MRSDTTTLLAVAGLAFALPAAAEDGIPGEPVLSKYGKKKSDEARALWDDGAKRRAAGRPPQERRPQEQPRSAPLQLGEVLAEARRVAERDQRRRRGRARGARGALEGEQTGETAKLTPADEFLALLQLLEKNRRQTSAKRAELANNPLVRQNRLLKLLWDLTWNADEVFRTVTDALAKFLEGDSSALGNLPPDAIDAALKGLDASLGVLAKRAKSESRRDTLEAIRAKVRQARDEVKRGTKTLRQRSRELRNLSAAVRGELKPEALLEHATQEVKKKIKGAVIGQVKKLATRQLGKAAAGPLFSILEDGSNFIRALFVKNDIDNLEVFRNQLLLAAVAKGSRIDELRLGPTRQRNVTVPPRIYRDLKRRGIDEIRTTPRRWTYDPKTRKFVDRGDLGVEHFPSRIALSDLTPVRRGKRIVAYESKKFPFSIKSAPTQPTYVTIDVDADKHSIYLIGGVYQPKRPPQQTGGK